jgi:hypothetical protein
MPRENLQYNRQSVAIVIVTSVNCDNDVIVTSANAMAYANATIKWMAFATCHHDHVAWHGTDLYKFHRGTQNEPSFRMEGRD